MPYGRIKVQKEKETPQTGKEKVMLEFVCSIPENIGWTLVGFVACLCVIMGIKVAKLLVQMWKDWHEDEEEEC